MSTKKKTDARKHAMKLRDRVITFESFVDLAHIEIVILDPAKQPSTESCTVPPEIARCYYAYLRGRGYKQSPVPNVVPINSDKPAEAAKKKAAP